MKNLFRKKKKMNLSVNTIIGIVEPTKIAKENMTFDKFNKEIILREGVEIKDNQIRWGRIIESIPYSEEAVESLVQIRKIPIIERPINRNKFIVEEELGGTLN